MNNIIVVIICCPSAVGIILIIPHAASFICLLRISCLLSFCGFPFLINASDSFAFAPFSFAVALGLAILALPRRVFALVGIVWAVIAEVSG